ncbi:MAG: DUF3427 domain-containing protein [Bacillaceae bacterium]
MAVEGIYEEIITRKLKRELEELDSNIYDIDKGKLDVEEAKKKLAQYISNVTRRALQYIREEYKKDDEALLSQIQTCNEIIDILSKRLEPEEFQKLKIDEEGEVLLSLYSKINQRKQLSKEKTIRPITSLSESSLFTGSSFEPNMLSEIKREILSSDSVDMLVSFIKWSGLRCILEDLEDLTITRGGKLRIITTSYMEATDYKAIEELSKLPNTEIKISYDVERTRLHAKAYLFKRETAFTTAYIGSSNMSNPALTSGLEWNVKVTEKDSFDIIKKFEATFESYWNDKEFVAFSKEKEEDKIRLKEALNKKKQEEMTIHYHFDIQPYHYQKELLEKLQVERETFGRYHNLLVAATGVGKTVVSAFDYKRYYQKNRPARLLFVAHREEILTQSLHTFRGILKDANFGDLLVGGRTPASIEHLFVSIQSFNSVKLSEKTTADYYDFIIIDEFHHAAAPTYQQLLNYYKPKILLGLTATPERMDGADILKYFNGKIAAEMRLTEAINRKLLAPFQYFAVSDETDLSKVKWSRRGYDIHELENVYTNNSMRSNQIIQSMKKYVTDMNEVKALGFCVSVEHAKYMAHYFNKSGIPAIALSGQSDNKTRQEAKDLLVSGKIKIIFVVDLYNEGVDIPEINTILFLRPTESLTVFIQQLGRGLRLSEDKECLTVLDFVGQAHKNYNFEEKFRALIGRTKHSVKHYLENGFLNLPKGCFIQLEKQAKDYILRNIKEAALTKNNLIGMISSFEADSSLPLTLENFLNYHQMTSYDFYGRGGKRSFKRLQVEAGVCDSFECENEEMITKGLPRLLHLNSKKLLQFLMTYLANGKNNLNEEERLMVGMLYYSFYSKEPPKEGFATMEEGIHCLLKTEAIREEMLEIVTYNYHQLDVLNIEPNFSFSCPLEIHSSYTTSQIMAAFNYFNEEKMPAFREGVKYFADKKLDAFFITLNKSEKDFSPSTLYEDYAINETLFHWQTQSKVGEHSPTAQRYIHHQQTGNKIALFVREYKMKNGHTSPFVFLGTASYVSHSGNKPMSFVWKLDVEMPPMVWVEANKSIV